MSNAEEAADKETALGPKKKKRKTKTPPAWCEEIPSTCMQIHLRIAGLIAQSAWASPEEGQEEETLGTWSFPHYLPLLEGIECIH